GCYGLSRSSSLFLMPSRKLPRPFFTLPLTLSSLPSASRSRSLETTPPTSLILPPSLSTLPSTFFLSIACLRYAGPRCQCGSAFTDSDGAPPRSGMQASSAPPTAGRASRPSPAVPARDRDRQR